MNLINTVLAQSTTGGQIVQDAAGEDFLISNILYWAIGVGALLALGAIIYGGLMYSTSGMVDKQAEAKEWIYGAIWGLGLLIFAALFLREINPEILKF